MRYTLLLALLCLLNMISQAQKSTTYVCPPCHSACDQLEFNTPGTCATCGMALMPKHSRLTTEEFSFNYEDVQYSAEVSKPATGKPTGVIVIIPGHGQTDFVGGGQFYHLRQFFSSLGLSTLVWDKKGCNKSGGTYEHHQSVESSAHEAVAAIAEFRRKYGAQSPVGLWGISRGGWICPLIIDEDPAISFWISVSGTDQFDTFPYMIETNFRLSGRSEAETDTLMKQFDHYISVLRHGGESYAQLVRSTEKLFSDPFYQSLGEKRISEAEFAQLRKNPEDTDHLFDPKTGRRMMIPGFDKILTKVKCPVLAILGERDTQVNWQGTRKLYEQTISHNLHTITLPDCNHNMMKCSTGAFQEDLSPFNWQACDGYEVAMKTWLKEKQFVK